MADNRLWYKVDVGYLDNPKVAELVDEHPRAVLLHQACIAYAKQHGTDGLVLVRVAMRRACAEQCDLDAAVASGLLIRVDDRHVRVHDYLEHQTSAEDDRNRSDKAKRAAEARWGRKNNAPSNAPSTPPGNAQSNAERNAEKSREEKRREEQQDSAGKPAPAATAELIPADRPDIIALCQHLTQRIIDNGNRPPTTGRRWHDAARLLLDRDHRPLDEAHQLIDWCQNDTFWRSNILSMDKFRAKYDTLRLQAQRTTKPATRGNGIDWQAALDLAAARDAQGDLTA